MQVGLNLGLGSARPHDDAALPGESEDETVGRGGMEILGLSLVTNAAAGMTGEPLNHEEVLAAGQAAATRMGDLLSKVIRAL